jgi:F0F1-type ATP synthase membrane subunit a
LAANLRAGHIVLTLMGVYLTYALISCNLYTSAILFLVQAGYTAFEVGICIIQAYIFCLLLSLYTEDHAAPDGKSLPFLNMP